MGFTPRTTKTCVVCGAPIGGAPHHCDSDRVRRYGKAKDDDVEDDNEAFEEERHHAMMAVADEGGRTILPHNYVGNPIPKNLTPNDPAAPAGPRDRGPFKFVMAPPPIGLAKKRGAA